MDGNMNLCVQGTGTKLNVVLIFIYFALSLIYIYIYINIPRNRKYEIHLCSLESKLMSTYSIRGIVIYHLL